MNRERDARRNDNRSSSSSSSRGSQQRSSSSSSNSNGGGVKRWVAWTVEPSRKEGAKDFWHPIGSAFRNKDGSFTVRLFALPLDGVVIIREPRERENDGYDQRQPGDD